MQNHLKSYRTDGIRIDDNVDINGKITRSLRWAYSGDGLILLQLELDCNGGVRLHPHNFFLMWDDGGSLLVSHESLNPILRDAGTSCTLRADAARIRHFLWLPGFCGSPGRDESRDLLLGLSREVQEFHYDGEDVL